MRILFAAGEVSNCVDDAGGVDDRLNHPKGMVSSSGMEVVAEIGHNEGSQRQPYRDHDCDCPLLSPPRTYHTTIGGTSPSTNQPQKFNRPLPSHSLLPPALPRVCLLYKRLSGRVPTREDQPTIAHSIARYVGRFKGVALHD